MKYSTAVGRLRKIAEDLSTQSKRPDPLIVEAFVYGEMLDAPPTIEWISLAFAVDLPPEDVTWMVRPDAAEAAASLLRFDKYPIAWHWRPSAWPVWNHEIVGPVRFWSIEGGADESALSLLTDGRIEQLERSSPADEEAFVRQLRTECGAARKHLESVVEAYHDRDWRRSHKGLGVYPEDHLWRATKGFLDLDDAVAKRAQG